MPSPVIAFLKNVADKYKYKTFDAMFGEIKLGESFPIRQSSGAVYGIWVNTDAPPKNGCAPIPDFAQWYPVYWGKDIAPMSRLKAHVQGHKNGNVNLPTIQEIHGHPLIFGGILVARYHQFEQLLHLRYPPLRGQSTGGKVSTVVRVDD
jgi:hypothetical protein